MRRPLTLTLTTALAAGLVIAPGGSSVATPSPSSVRTLGATIEGEQVLVGGLADFGGVALVSVATDPAGDSPLPAELGGDLVEASIGQPDASTGDLSLVLRVAQLPEHGGTPEAVRYIWDISVNGLAGPTATVPFQIEGKFTDALRRQSTRNPSFVLRGGCVTENNVTTCSTESALDATTTPATSEIAIRLPRRLLEEQLGASIAGTTIGAADVCEGISAKASAYFSLCNGAGEGTGDIMLQEGTYAVGTPEVRIAVTAPGEAPDFAAGQVATLDASGGFTAAVPAAGLVEGESEVWARACFGPNCGVAGVTLGTEAEDLVPTWNPPVLVHATQAHRETSLALSPTDPNLMFICDPSGVPNTANNQSYFHVSRNGGTSWTPIDVEGGSTDPRNYAFEGGDCDVAFDEGGTMYTADTWLGNLSIGHSFDGGTTWDGTSVAASVPVVDRPWLAGGPDGTLHVTYQDLQCCSPSAIWYTRSTDHGRTFLPAVPVADAGPDGVFTWEGNPVVAPGGQDLYLIYTRRNTLPLTDLDSGGPETVWIAASHDAGLTWTSTLIASMPTPASYLYPSLAMDAGGNLHAVWASKTSTDRPIWYAFSDDEGATWSDPLALMRGAAGYSPWVAGGSDGEAAVTWIGSPNPAAYNNVPADWYFYAARITDAHTGSPQVDASATTAAPVFTGLQTVPEFEMVRLDDAGMMHLGMSIYRRTGSVNRWAIYYQSQSLLPR